MSLMPCLANKTVALIQYDRQDLSQPQLDVIFTPMYFMGLPEHIDEGGINSIAIADVTVEQLKEAVNGVLSQTEDFSSPIVYKSINVRGERFATLSFPQYHSLIWFDPEVDLDEENITIKRSLMFYEALHKLSAGKPTYVFGGFIGAEYLDELEHISKFDVKSYMYPSYILNNIYKESNNSRNDYPLVITSENTLSMYPIELLETKKIPLLNNHYPLIPHHFADGAIEFLKHINVTHLLL